MDNLIEVGYFEYGNFEAFYFSTKTDGNFEFNFDKKTTKTG